MNHETITPLREAVGAIYRTESRRVFATLVRLLGDFDTAEEALHDAFRAALEQWPRDGIPANPRAWLVSAGRFKAIDAIRRRERIDALDDDAAENIPAAEPPESEDIGDDRLRLMFTSEHAFEFAWVTPLDPFQPEARPPQQNIWFRAAGTLPDEPMLHRNLLAYASDFNLASTALLPHSRSWFSSDMIVASIDHALWIHRDFRADDWLLYAMDSPTAQSVRGMTRGLIYDRHGRLVASAAQECLMRRVTR